MRLKLLPVFLMIAGLAAGVGAGFAFRPPPDPAAGAEGEAAGADSTEKAGEPAEADEGHPPAEGGSHDAPPEGYDYVRFSNQFVVPLLQQGRVASIVVLGLSVEVKAGLTERVYELEPKLRDALLQVMFDHANAGGFEGDFTEGIALEPLRDALRETAIRVFGADLSDVLILDIVRQDG